MQNIELAQHIVEMNDNEMNTLKQTLEHADTKKLPDSSQEQLDWYKKIIDKLPLRQEKPPHIIEFYHIELTTLIELVERWIKYRNHLLNSEQNPTTITFQKNNIQKRCELLIKLKISL